MRKTVKNERKVSAEKLAELKEMAAKILAETRRALIQRQPFTGSVAMNLDLVPVRDIGLETAATDGKKIFFDIDFLTTLTAEERLFVLGHEVWHNLMCHFVRNENRNRQLMNVATDLEVNQILVKDGFALPKLALMPDKFGLPPDLAAEDYYEYFVKNDQNPDADSFDQHSYGDPQQNENDSGDTGNNCGNGNNDDKQDSEQGQYVSDKYGTVGRDPDYNPGSPKDGVERIREAAVSAAQVMERQRGTLPAHIKGLVEALLKPEIDWREQLQQFVTRSCGGENRNWNPPNRRHVHSGLYLQSRKGEKIRITVGLDVSGSTQQDIPKFLGELNGLVTSFGKYELDVIQCDTEVQSYKRYSDDEPLDLENEKFEILGCGGTKLHPIFDKISEIAEDEGTLPNAIVILTDGFIEHFGDDDDPGIPVMWVVSNGGSKDFTEFGDVVELKSRK